MSEPVFDLAEDPDGLLLRSLPLLRSVVGAAARRWRLKTEDAEDLLSEVQIKLLENGGEALRSCHEADRLRAFLATVVARHLLDRRNHDWGKWRPCAEAKRQGADGELLDQLIHRDGLSIEEAAEKLRQRGIEWSREEIERRAALFPARSRRRLESEEALENRPAATASPEEALLLSESAARRERALGCVRQEMARLPPEETLMVRSWMRGATVTAIALELAVERRPLYRRFEALWKELRAMLERNGIGAAEVKEILSLERWDDEMRSPSPSRNDEEPENRPSERIDEPSRPNRR